MGVVGVDEGKQRLADEQGDGLLLVAAVLEGEDQLVDLGVKPTMDGCPAIFAGGCPLHGGSYAGDASVQVGPYRQPFVLGRLYPRLQGRVTPEALGKGERALPQVFPPGMGGVGKGV